MHLAAVTPAAWLRRLAGALEGAAAWLERPRRPPAERGRPRHATPDELLDAARERMRARYY